MVRSGVVDHPSQWPFCGYNEIQEPRSKNVLINYDKLRELVGVESYDLVKRSHIREPSAPYGEHFRVKNEDIGADNAYFWDINSE